MPKTKEKVITLSVSEFNRLKKKARAYEALAASVFELPLRSSVEEVISDFRNSKLYTSGFLKDLESGLKKSSWSSNH